MLKLDRKKFWKGYHSSFDAHGPTTQKTVDALNDILDRFETDTRLKYISWYAYALATSYHETGINGNHFVPVKEGKARPSSEVWKKYQSKYWGTGFYGRGQIQTTHKENYAKLGKDLGVGDLFVENPDLLLTAKWSYESLIHGMVKGIYRGDAKGRKNLARYLKGDDASVQDYVNARDIVNGDVKKNGLMIANYAEKFEHILFASRLSGEDNNTTANAVTAPVVDPPKTTDELTVSSPDATQIEQTIVEEVDGTLVSTTTVDAGTVKVASPEPYQGIGFIAVIKRDVAAIGGGNLTFQGLSEYAQQASGWPEWLVGILTKLALIALGLSVLWIVYRLVHYTVDSWKKAKKVEVEAAANTDKNRFNIEWS